MEMILHTLSRQEVQKLFSTTPGQNVAEQINK